MTDAESIAPSNAPSLRVGLMVGGMQLRHWQAEVVRSLLAVSGVEIVLAVVDDRPTPRTRRDRRTVLWDLYNNRWVARRAVSLRREPLRDLLPDVEELRCRVETRGRWSEHFTPGDVRALRDRRIDVLVRFGFGIIRGDILDVPRFGVWSYHHDDEEVVRGGPPAFWEIVDSLPTTGVTLQRLTDRLDGGYVLHKGWFRTEPTSYVRNTDAAHLGAADWPARLCRALVSGDHTVAIGVRSRSTAPIRRKPSNRQTAAFLTGLTRRWVRRQWRSLVTADHWEVGAVAAPIHAFLDDGFDPDPTWLDLGTEPGTYAADPFPVVRSDAIDVLYEHFDQRTRSGEIRVARLGSGTAATPALPLAAHASYPFVLTDRGRVYCLPQVDGQRARLYELTGERWVPGPEIGPDEPVRDPTLLEHRGRWWLFATPPGRWSNTALHVWWADELDGPWHPHLLNPVKTDVRSARPAGTPFSHGGRLYRPAQDGSVEYGGAVTINEVTVLGVDAFDERIVATVGADPRWPFDRGIHTLAAAGDVTLIDAKRHRFDRHETRAELAARLQRGR